MSKFTKELVDNLADKLLIGLSDEENEMVLSEFDKIDENIDLIIPNMTEEVNMSLNERINFEEVELNGSKIATNSFNISISNNNVAYKDNYNIKGIVAQNIGTSNIEVEVDLGYYKKTFNYDISQKNNKLHKDKISSWYKLVAYCAYYKFKRC